jgi:multidrug resistance efflux pump
LESQTEEKMTKEVEAQLKQLDIEMAKAKTQGEKDMIKERQDELKRQLSGQPKKAEPAKTETEKPKAS